MKILLIQTAFIGDVILATALLEELHASFPSADIDFLLRKGNETLFNGHPFLHNLLVWDKKKSKLFNLAKIIRKVRNEKYDLAINLHRFASSGMVMFLSAAKQKIGFDKNPFSFCYDKKIKHTIGDGKHEVERNGELISSLTKEQSGNKIFLPRLYPQPSDLEKIRQYQSSPYICIAPASVWFTKQFPAHKWIEFIDLLNDRYKVYLLGSAGDSDLCRQITSKVKNQSNAQSLAGELSLLQSAALMQGAGMNYVNDSAPMHLASAVNAPMNAVFCSTVPAFGFGPLSKRSFVIETAEKLDCRPCGLHGYAACPKGHFRCAESIAVEGLLKNLDASA